MGRSDRRLKRRTQRRRMTQTEINQAFGAPAEAKLPPVAAAMAGFRAAAEYQQFVSEILQHAIQTADQLPEDHLDTEYFLGAVEALQERYFEARRYAHDRGVETIEEMDPQREDARIIVPELKIQE